MNLNTSVFVRIAKAANAKMHASRRANLPWLASHWRCVKVLNLCRARKARLLEREGYTYEPCDRTCRDCGAVRFSTSCKVCDHAAALASREA